MQNGFCESFNGCMRDELLNESLFLGLDHASTKITNWVDDYNQRRPHSALGYLHPGSLCRQISPQHAIVCATPMTKAPPIACCSTRAPSLKTRRGSNRRWMILQWQVRIDKIGDLSVRSPSPIVASASNPLSISSGFPNSPVVAT